MMGSFREIVVGRPPGLPPGRMAQSVDIAYPALHNPAAKGASLMTCRVVSLIWLGIFAATPILATAPVTAQEPLRLGVLTIRSGPIASCGRQMEEGLQFGLKERGGMLGGRKVEVFFGDSAGQPAQTRAKTLELVERNRVHVLTPIVTPDYAPFIAQLKTNVDAIYAGFGPTNGQRFLKQYSEFGLKLPVLGMVTTTEESSLKSTGDEALGVITAGTYSAAIDTPTNRKWVQAMRAEYKDDPGYCTIGGSLGVLFVDAGLKGAGGRVEDKAAFMKALRAVQLADTPQGPIRLDAYGNPIVNV
jgi:ABC-type branched-subunit amino acid transport system substrate-binding protein